MTEFLLITIIVIVTWTALFAILHFGWKIGEKLGWKVLFMLAQWNERRLEKRDNHSGN